MPTLNVLKELVNNLSLFEEQELKNFLAVHVDDHDIANSIENARFSNGIYCPHCGYFEHIMKFGKY